MATLGLVTATTLAYLCVREYGDRSRLLLFTVYLPLAAFLVGGLLRQAQRVRTRERALIQQLAAEKAAREQLCLSVIESLAYAIEARTPYSIGHLARVQAYTLAIAQEMGVPPKERDGMRVAALLHDIGRLGVPDNILAREGALTEPEREKIRAYPVLGGRILAAIPFPWPVVDIVRHHREHYDGMGCPDGLSGEAIPLGARILAVADAYASLTLPRGPHPAHTHEEAMRMIREVSGTQFDPRVVEALAAVVDRTNARLAREEAGYARQSAAAEIARAQQEVQALHALAWEVSTDLRLDAMLETLAERVRAIVNCSACVFYLLEPDEEYLHASAAFGVNQAAFRNSAARVGTYLTGRVASRGEAICASYMADDILFSPTEEVWTPLRATLIVPLRANGNIIGTINLYHTEPNAFQSDDLRVMLYVGQLAGRAIQNARLFSQTEETALTDPLTGLRNARYLRHFLEQEMDRATRNRRRLAVLGLDLDGFKMVNDRYGHARGDEVLCEIGQLFRMQVRKEDLVARYGGDEFAVVLPGINREEARIVAAKLERAVDRYAASLIQGDPDFPPIGVSVGVVVFPEDASSLEALLECADRAMYRNKRARRAA